MDNPWITIVVTFAGVAVLALAIYFVYRRQNPAPGKGKPRGRAYNSGQVVGAMRGFARGNKFSLIAPATLQRGDATAALDAVVVGYFGVLGVISLGYSGEIYGAAADERWVQVAEDGTRTKFQNPINEASAAVRVIRDALFAQKQRKIPVEVVYVFAHPQPQLALPRSIEYLRLKDFKKLLKKDKYLDDCGLDMEKVTAAIRDSVVD